MIEGKGGFGNGTKKYLRWPYAIHLLNRILAIYGPKVYNEKLNSIKAGPKFPERMLEFYDWCYERRIIPFPNSTCQK